MPLDIRALVTDPSSSIEAIGAALDALSAEERLAAGRSLGRGEQRQLYAKAAASPALTSSNFVPDGVAPRVPVRHLGCNTLPLPHALRFFEKRFCRPEDGSARLFGYNEGPFRPLIGPGYFVAKSTAGEPRWAERGGIVVDYFEVPDGPVAEGWPRVVSNSHGLQFFVYRRTRDFMRRVSAHVTIGAAFKGEKALDHFFVLVRAG
jgi:hypothetical protein